MHFHGECIGDVWEELLKATYESENTVNDDGMELRELLNVIVTVEAPIPAIEEDPFLHRNKDDDMIQWMHDNFHSMTPIDGWGYSYGSRFFNFNGINQIEYVKEKLDTEPDSKSATISAMNPPDDSKHVPCICTVDFKIRDGLILTAFFRSQDVGKKFAPDLLALHELFEDIAGHLDVGRNKFVIHIASAHIYESDYELVEEMLHTTLGEATNKIEE